MYFSFFRAQGIEGAATQIGTVLQNKLEGFKVAVRGVSGNLPMNPTYLFRMGTYV